MLRHWRERLPSGQALIAAASDAVDAAAGVDVADFDAAEFAKPLGKGGAGRFPGEVGGGEGAISGVRRALRSLPDPNQHRCAVIR